jgi:hypothetical protein
MTCLRYFREQMPDLHVVAAGSFFEFILGDISMPMGRVDYCYVRPMDFGEFLFATGRSMLHDRRPDLRDSIATISS